MSTELAPLGHQQLTFSSLTDIETFATKIAKSQFVPTQFRDKPYDVIAAIVYGMERGLSPMASLQNIAVINGRPNVYGDMLLAMCLSDPSTEYIDESTLDEIKKADAAWCEAKRKGGKVVRRSFSKQDAITAGLWGKGTWHQYPYRMLQMRARSWCLRDAYADRLMGLQAREEAEDIIDVTPEPAGRSVPSLHAPVPPVDLSQESVPVQQAMARTHAAEAKVKANAVNHLTKPELLEAITYHLSRLGCDDQGFKAALVREHFGKTITGRQKLEALNDGSLRTGLKKLMALPTPSEPWVVDGVDSLYGIASEMETNGPTLPQETTSQGDEYNSINQEIEPTETQGFAENMPENIPDVPQDVRSSANPQPDLLVPPPPEDPHLDFGVVCHADVEALFSWMGFLKQEETFWAMAMEGSAPGGPATYPDGLPKIGKPKYRNIWAAGYRSVPLTD